MAAISRPLPGADALLLSQRRRRRLRGQRRNLVLAIHLSQHELEKMEGHRLSPICEVSDAEHYTFFRPPAYLHLYLIDPRFVRRQIRIYVLVVHVPSSLKIFARSTWGRWRHLWENCYQELRVPQVNDQREFDFAVERQAVGINSLIEREGSKKWQSDYQERKGSMNFSTAVTGPMIILRFVRDWRVM